MAQEYLPAPSNVRLADLMKEHNISQPELAKEIGCSKSTISRFISGAKGTLTHEQVLKIARLFNVSTDFLLGETNIPDRTKRARPWTPTTSPWQASTSLVICPAASSPTTIPA